MTREGLTSSEGASAADVRAKGCMMPDSAVRLAAGNAVLGEAYLPDHHSGKGAPAHLLTLPGKAGAPFSSSPRILVACAFSGTMRSQNIAGKAL